MTVAETSGVSAFCDDVLGDADAVEIARRIEAREIHPSEAVEAAIARAERVDPSLNAIATPLFDHAREEAERPRGGLFAGVPSFVKDTDAVAGSPVLYGSRGLPRKPADKTSAFAKQFLSLGLVNLGKTTTPEFGLTGTTEALLYGPTHNPWRLGYTPGGSSGGSAALVAAGVVPIAHANDGAGSIRIPASCCGLVGLKPSRGRFAAVEGSEFLPINILHQGIVSRSVRDTAAFVLGAEGYHRNPRLPEVGSVARPGGRRLRIGFFTHAGDGQPVDLECVTAVTDVAKLCESLGHSVREVRPPFVEGFHRAFFRLWATMAFVVTRFGKQLIHPEFDRTKVEELTEGLALHFKKNVPGTLQAIWQLKKAAQRYERSFERVDLLLSPTLATPPPELGYLGPEVPFTTSLKRLGSFIPFTPIQNVSGGPAISLPLARSRSGLPIGVQFASPMGRERTLLELALELEEASPWARIGTTPLPHRARA